MTKKLKKNKPEKSPEVQTNDICPGCGQSVRPNTSFCWSCGQNLKEALVSISLEIPLVCSCGEAWKDNAKFCWNCGAQRPIVEIDNTICPNGHKNTPDSMFCMYCGEIINPNK